jgi:outer membrane scaffolding protein for murein synthesis (MipA/OmpV family)
VTGFVHDPFTTSTPLAHDPFLIIDLDAGTPATRYTLEDFMGTITTIRMTNTSHAAVSRRRIRGLAAAVVAVTLVALPAATSFAADQGDGLPLFPLPSVLDFTRGGGWGFALGAAVEYESAYDGSDEMELEVEPAGAVHWRRGNHLIFWEGIELGWRSRVADDWLLQLNARSEGGREADDSEEGYLDGLQDRDDELVGVLEVRRALGRDWRGWVAGRIMAGGSDFGTLGVLAAGYRFGQKLDGTGTELFGFTTLGDADFINRDFGVSEQESIDSGLPATELDAGFRSVGLTALHRSYLAKKLMLMASATYEHYSGDIEDSPIVRRGYEYELGVSLVYHF